MKYFVREISGSQELELVMQLRIKVFVEEQSIPIYLEQDGRDSVSKHVAAFVDEEVVACGRLSPAKDPKLGILSRIAVDPGNRRKGLGRKIVEGIETLAQDMGYEKLQLKPHAYLLAFYEGMGYKKVDETIESVGKHPLILMEKVF